MTRPGDTEQASSDSPREAGSSVEKIQSTSDTELVAERDVEPVTTPGGDPGDTDLPLESNPTDL